MNARCVTPGVVKRREAQRRQFNFRFATIDSTISTGTPSIFRMPPHTKLISNDGAILKKDSKIEQFTIYIKWLNNSRIDPIDSSSTFIVA